jgi:hypothetical protein
MAADLLRVAVYFDSDEAGEQAKQALERTDAEYSGVVEGQIAREQLAALSDAGIVVQALEAPLEAEYGRPTRDIEDFKEEAELVSFAEDDRALVSGVEPAASRDPRLHRYFDSDSTPTPGEAAPEDVYYIKLPGPITQAQRLELDGLGVNIAAFVPGHGYRAFLAREQYQRVLELPYVTGCERYDFGHVVTPELLETIEEVEADDGASLLADSPEPAEPLVFDCLVHREEDLVEIRELIDNSSGTTIVGNSNLRVRFEAEPKLPFLAALAALPEVRKLSTFEEPTL